MKELKQEYTIDGRTVTFIGNIDNIEFYDADYGVYVVRDGDVIGHLELGMSQAMGFISDVVSYIGEEK